MLASFNRLVSHFVNHAESMESMLQRYKLCSKQAFLALVGPVKMTIIVKTYGHLITTG